MSPIPQRRHLFFAVMGITGSGKSSFIKDVTGCENIAVGDGLDGCTQRPQIYGKDIGNDVIYLIDTPGFDDHSKGDAGVLEEVATFLALQYNQGHRLTGVLYLHPISETRMKASSRLNLEMFENLCGVATFTNVMLVSTMWDNVAEEVGVRRERQLMDRNEFWGTMVSNGAGVVRHTRSLESGVQVLSQLIDKSAVVLDIQRQMIDERQNLNNTPAGRILRKQILKQEERHNKNLADLKTKLEKIEEEGREKLNLQIKETQQVVQDLKYAKDRLGNTQSTIEEREKQYRDDLLNLQKEVGSKWGTWATTGVGLLGVVAGVGGTILLGPVAAVAAPALGVAGAASLLAIEIGGVLSGFVASFAAAPAVAAGAGSILAGLSAAEVVVGGGIVGLGALAAANGL